jgi:gliding motility-associated-like protein
VDSGYVSLDVTSTNTSSNATNYSWTINNSAAGSSSIFTHTFDNEGSYTVTLTASNGTCSDVATKTILAKILPPPVIIIPNIFTPNGDGANDEFFVEAQGAKDLSLEIFNRWGNMIHTLKGLTNGISDKWDGKGFSDGTYFYKYKLTDLKDNTSEGNGFFHLAR